MLALKLGNKCALLQAITQSLRQVGSLVAPQLKIRPRVFKSTSNGLADLATCILYVYQKKWFCTTFMCNIHTGCGAIHKLFRLSKSKSQKNSPYELYSLITSALVWSWVNEILSDRKKNEDMNVFPLIRFSYLLVRLVKRRPSVVQWIENASFVNDRVVKMNR